MLDTDNVERLAREALDTYGVTDARLSILKASNNIVYRVDAGGQRYVLRVHRPGNRQRVWIESELMWLAAIRRDTDLRVPEPVEPVYYGRVGQQPVYCTLLHWLEGEQVQPDSLTLDQAWALGIFTARLHKHSAGFVPQSGFALPRLDWSGMYGESSPYLSVEGEKMFTQAQLEVLNEVTTVVGKVLKTLDDEPHNSGIIHADLIWKNILFEGDNVGAIDFDDCAYGYYLYDLAPALLGYMDEPNFPQIRRAIWDGYTSIRPLPTIYSDYLSTLVAGRHALSCWWIAANQNNPSIGKRAPKIIANRVSELQRFLETGELRRGEIVI